VKTVFLGGYPANYQAGLPESILYQAPDVPSPLEIEQDGETAISLADVNSLETAVELFNNVLIGSYTLKYNWYADCCAPMYLLHNRQNDFDIIHNETTTMPPYVLDLSGGTVKFKLTDTAGNPLYGTDGKDNLLIGHGDFMTNTLCTCVSAYQPSGNYVISNIWPHDPEGRHLMIQGTPWG
jgi:hypothetical protein